MVIVRSSAFNGIWATKMGRLANKDGDIVVYIYIYNDKTGRLATLSTISSFNPEENLLVLEGSLPNPDWWQAPCIDHFLLPWSWSPESKSMILSYSVPFCPIIKIMIIRKLYRAKSHHVEHCWTTSNTGFDPSPPPTQNADTTLRKLLEVDDAVAVDVGFVPETIQAVAGQIWFTSGHLQSFRRNDAFV